MTWNWRQEHRHPADLQADADARAEMTYIRTHPCPKCHATEGQLCRRPDGKPMVAWTHPERTRQAIGPE